MAPQSDKMLQIDPVDGVCSLALVFGDEAVFQELFEVEGSHGGAAQLQLLLQLPGSDRFIAGNEKSIDLYGCSS